MSKTVLFLLLLPLLLFSYPAYSQDMTVRGTISGDPDGQPVAGASIMIKGSMTGVISDGNGQYSINADRNDILVFSCLGFKDVEIKVGQQTIIDVTLPVDAQMLEEVISVGYGTVRKSDLTGSVASVKASDVIQSASASIDKMLQGRIAGLTIIDNTNDSPEASVTVRVRGISSINGSNAPLIVVDGVPMGDAGNLTSVNPNIIESIEVLKDASATAIYGSRGANGVIMITTKSGAQEHTNFWFNSKVGVGVFSDRLDYWRDPVMMAKLENESYENGGAEGPYTGKVWSDGTYYPSIAEIESGEWPFRTDWADYVFRTSVTQDYNIGVEGSSEKSKYYASLGYYSGQGMQYNDDYQKVSMDMSYDNKILDNFNLRTKAGFVRGFRDYNNGTKVTPVFRVRYGGRTVFQIDPATGNVFFGEPNSGLKTAKTGFMYRASDQTIRSAGDNVIIKADGTIEAKDGTFSGTVNATAGEMTDITISGDSIFNGELQAASICTRPVSEEDTTPASGIFTTAEEIYKVIDEEFGINETQLYPCVVEGDDSIRYLSVHYTEFPEIEGYLYQIFFYNAEKKVMNTDDWITSCEVYAVTPEYPNGVIMDGPDASLNGRSQLTSMGYKEQGMDCYIVTRRKEAYSLSLSVFLNQILQVFVPLSSNGAGLKNNQVYRTSDGTLKVHIDNS